MLVVIQRRNAYLGVLSLIALQGGDQLLRVQDPQLFRPRGNSDIKLCHKEVGLKYTGCNFKGLGLVQIM